MIKRKKMTLIQPLNVHELVPQQLQPKKKKLNSKKRNQKTIKSTNRYADELIVQKKRIKGQPIEFLQARKQSYIASCINKRKRALLEITKQNHRLYKKINSQQSDYCSVNKSVVSNKSISMSRCSKKFTESRNSPYKSQKEIRSKKFLRSHCSSSRGNMKIEHQNIKQIKNNRLQDFCKLFPTKSQVFRPKSAAYSSCKYRTGKQNRRNQIEKEQIIEEIQFDREEHDLFSKEKQKKENVQIQHKSIQSKTRSRRVFSALQRNRPPPNREPIQCDIKIKY